MLGYEGLKNAGFEIIQSDSLRNEILDLFEVTYTGMSEFNNYFLSFQPEREAYIEELFLYDYSQNPVRLPPIDYESLVNNNKFLSMLIAIKVQRDAITSEVRNSLAESQRVLQLIQQELGESDFVK